MSGETATQSPKKMIPTKEQVMPVLQFDKEGIAEIGRNEENTMIAIAIVVVNALIAGIASAISGQTFGFGTTTATISPVSLAIISIINSLITYFLLAWMIPYVVGWFGGSSVEMMNILRMLGFTAIWGLIGSVLSLIPALFSLSFIFGILGFIAFAMGLSVATEMSVVKAIIATLVAAIIVGIISSIVGFILFPILS